MFNRVYFLVGGPLQPTGVVPLYPPLQQGLVFRDHTLTGSNCLLKLTDIYAQVLIRFTVMKWQNGPLVIKGTIGR